VRAGAGLGQFVPPEFWRRASAPLVARLTGPDAGTRPRLEPEQRARLVPDFEDDVRLLSKLTGEDYSDWVSTQSRGSFDDRRPPA
jgi:hypothetical protein